MLTHLEDLVVIILLLYSFDYFLPTIFVIIADRGEEILDSNIFLQLALQKCGRFTVLPLLPLAFENRGCQRVKVIELDINHELLGNLQNKSIVLALCSTDDFLLVSLALPWVTLTDMTAKSLPSCKGLATANMLASERTQVEPVNLLGCIAAILID